MFVISKMKSAISSFLSCKRYSERASRSFDEELSLWDRIGFVFHHYWCFTCRTFYNQIERIENCLGVLAKRSKELDPESDEKLTQIASAKIRTAVQSEIEKSPP